MFQLKGIAKDWIGRALPLDAAEKLTEYSILARPEMSFAASEEIRTSGTSWSDVVERGREEMWRKGLTPLNESDLLLLEFGVWQGYSISYFSKLNQRGGSRFWGFDSFEGLPADWRGMLAGHFSTGGKPPTLNDQRVRFVKGWFQETLYEQLPALREQAVGRKIVVHLDADLYSSTLFLLSVLGPEFRQFICIFDEFAGHEARALYNFMEAFNAKWEPRYHTRWKGAPTGAFGLLTVG